MLKLKFYSDAGHGWLAVKLSKLVAYGLADKISSCSYMRGQTVYLEEDCDAGLFLNELKARGIAFNLVEGKWAEYSPIRYYQHYSAPTQES